MMTNLRFKNDFKKSQIGGQKKEGLQKKGWLISLYMLGGNSNNFESSESNQKYTDD